MMDEIDFLVRLRDGAQTIADAANECLESKSPFPKWDSNKVKWESVEGPSGPYERSQDADNRNFKLLVKDLAAHDGKLTKDAFFYWLFKNGSVVGRKRK